MSLLSWIILFSLVSGTLSLIGGLFLLQKSKWVLRFSMHFVSFAVGAMLGTVFLELLPEAFDLALAKPESLFLFTLGGIFGFFVLEGLILRFHPHHHGDENGRHHHPTPILLTIGDMGHNFVDGIVIAVAFLTNIPLGIITALAIAAHELPQEMSDFTVMLVHGWSRRKVLWTNLLSSLTNLAGAVVTFCFRGAIEPVQPQLLAIAAGIFIYIATVDLIPELSAEPQTRRDKFFHVLTLVSLGIGVVWIFKLLLEGG